MQTGLVVETAEAREVHHFCVLAGFGAEAVNPYLAFETLEELRQNDQIAVGPRRPRSARITSGPSARAC